MSHWTHNLNPTLLSAGPITIRWYGFMYLVGFVVGLIFMARRHKRGLFALNAEESQVLISYLMIGMMFCARLFYCAVYNPSYYWEHPNEIIAIWQGGLSFHGAAIGFILAMLYYGKKNGVGFFHLSDTVAMGAAQGIFWGRLGNFINGELYGRPSDVPWAIIFPSGGPQPRHPSQLYQGLLEGVAVFVILHIIEFFEQKNGHAPKALTSNDLKSAAATTGGKKAKRQEHIQVWKRTGVLGCSFLVLYGLARFIVEFFREPDAQLGYYAEYFTMGQILCVIMMIVGAFLVRYVIKNPRREEYPWPT